MRIHRNLSPFNSRAALNLLLAVALLALGWIGAPSGLAQTPTATSTPTPGPRPIGNSETISLTLEDLGYDEVTLNGPLGQATFYVGLPANWEVSPGSSLTLALNFAVPGLNTVATAQASSHQIVGLRVALNGASIYQTVLDKPGQQTLNIRLPDVWPDRSPSGRDRFDVFLRVQGPCEDTLLTSLTILKSSFLTVAYRTTALALDLAKYPSPFYEYTFLPKSAFIVLPGQPSRTQMDGALALAAGLGNLTNNTLAITATTDLDWDQANPLHEHLILIGTPASNSLLRNLNGMTPWPAPLQPRRMQLITTGPDVAVLTSTLTYTVQVTNTETVSVTALSLRSRLPYSVKNAACQPACQLDDDQAVWQMNALLPGASAVYTLSFTLPTTNALEAIDLTSELAQNQTAINVSTLESPVRLDVEPSPTHTVQVGDAFFVLNGQVVPETDGVIELLPSPWQPDKAVLLVTGLTDEAVFKAGRALGATSQLPGMQGQVALVQEVFPRPGTNQELTEDFTLADRGYSDVVVNGAGRQDTYYRFDLPLSWRLTEDASIRFHFSHSSLLDPTRSSLTLIFNSTPFASVALDQTNAVIGELNAPLPPRSARPGQSNTLLVRVEARLMDPCADSSSGQAWTTLSASSSLHLTHLLNDVSGYLDLKFLPLPLSAQPNLADVMLVLPDQPSALESSATLRIISQLGAASGGDSFQPAALLGDPAGTDLAPYHLIVVGRPTRNPLLQLVNDALPQPFIPGTDTIRQQIDDIVFRLPPGLDLGYVQLLQSAWNKERVLLAVTGTTDLGMSWAARALATSSRLGQLKGNLALLRDVEVFTTDTRDLTAGGKVAAVTTAVPEATVVGTATPTPTPIATSTLEAPGSSNRASSSSRPSSPAWLPAVIIGGVAIIVAILGIVIWRARRTRSKM
jgi:hypothetical protein